jgi:ribonuclease-3
MEETMSIEKMLRELEMRIGYQFHNSELLRQALIHSSYSNEHRMDKLYNNERLEFLGDAVLEVISSEYLYHKYPDYPEGKLTRLRASMVCEPTLALCTKELELGKYLLLGKGEDATGGRDRDSIMSDALEAVIGAIYLDGGLANAKEFIEKFILNDLENKQLFFDSKTILQEMTQGQYKEPLYYELVSETGPDHNKNFTTRVMIGGEELGRGDGRTKKASEQQAAYQAIMKLKEKES